MTVDSVRAAFGKTVALGAFLMWELDFFRSFHAHYPGSPLSWLATFLTSWVKSDLQTGSPKVHLTDLDLILPSPYP